MPCDGALCQMPLPNQRLRARVARAQDILHNEVFPLWCVAPEASGGLGLDSSDLGWLISASGTALLVYQMFIFAPISRTLPPASAYRLRMPAACRMAVPLAPPIQLCIK